MKSLRFRPIGLWTNPGAQVAPPGGLSVAQEMVINRPGLISSRRGYALLTGTVPKLGSAINRLTEYNDRLVAHNGTANLHQYNGSIWTALSTDITQPDVDFFKTMFCVAKQNLYVTSSKGVRRLSTINAPVDLAGELPAPSFWFPVAGATYATPLYDATAAAGLELPGVNWLADQKDVAYRYCFFKKDRYGDPITGPVSGRHIVSNTGGATRAVKLRAIIPREMVTASSGTAQSYDGYFLELYRSAQVDTGTTPSDEMQKVFEIAVTSTDVTNGYVLLHDIVDDLLRQKFLYTNPTTGKGIQSNNLPPPLCRDLALWKDRMWGGYITQKHRFTLQIIAAGGTDGIQATDTIALDGRTYTCVAGVPAANQYHLDASGSAALRVERTALSLVEAINRDASSNLYAIYSSKPDDPLTIGRIDLERRTYGGSAFNPRVGVGSKQTCFFPVLPTTAATDDDVASSLVDLQEGLMWSKPGVPDAWPAGNLKRVGSPDKPIQRIIGLGDRLWIFKEDGVYIVTGESENNFSVSLWDPTIVIVGRDTAVQLANEIWLYCLNGVVSVSSAGQRWRSGDPIDKTLLDLLAEQGGAPGLTNIQKKAFAIGYESDGKYILAMPAGAELAVYYFVCNLRGAGAWTRWAIGARSCGMVRGSDDRLYFGDQVAPDSAIHVERKARTNVDYQDETTAIPRTVTFLAEFGKDPTAQKQFVEVVALFENEPTGSVSITCSSENANGSADTIPTNSNGMRRTLVQRDVSRGIKLTVTVSDTGNSQQAFDLAGIKLRFREYDGKATR